MDVNLRAGRPDDAAICGRICFEAFTAISTQHNFPPDWPSVEQAQTVLTALLARPGVRNVVAELDGQVVGSNFMAEIGRIGGIGPITVAPAVQNGAIGRRMMEHMLAVARERSLIGVRLVQAAFHGRSMSLYAKLGFTVREPLACMQGPPIGVRLPGCTVRPAARADLETGCALCVRVHGHERREELREAIEQGLATVVERDGRLTGYATVIGFWGHAVAASTDDLTALIAAAPAVLGAGILVPTRNGELFRWCLTHGLRVTQPLTLMSLGFYNEAAGAFLPSILF
jgi:GNAT superfamily N-acetyltransferase